MMALSHLTSITIENAQSLYIEVLAALKTKNSIILDLQFVQTIDSAGLASLIGMLAAAKKTHSNISFINIPEFIQRIAQIHNVEACLKS